MSIWLTKEISGMEMLSFVSICLIAEFAYAVVGLKICAFLGFDIPKVRNSESALSMDMTRAYSWLALFSVVFCEEVIFRLPLALVVWLDSSMTSMKGILIVAILSSVVFGMLHGSVRHILFQGVGGVLKCIVFLKCGGGSGHYIKALLVVSTMHFIYVVILIAIAFWVSGATKKGAV